MNKLIITAGTILLLASCGGKGDENKSGPSGADSLKNDKIKSVEVTPLVPQLFNHFVDIQGKIDADENVTVNAEMPGTVAKVNVRLGDAVSPGQVLAELDSKVIQQGISELQTALDLATTLYEKQKNLWEQKIGTEVQYLGAKSNKEGLEKRMSTLQEQLKMSKMVSPISGIVDAVDIKIGQATMPGLPAIRVLNLNTLKVKGEVAESYLAKVKSGNEVIVILPDMHDTVRTKISYAAKVISPLNRTFTITINLDGNKEYHPNQIAIIKIIDYTNPKAIVVPVNSIQRAEEGDFVFISKGSLAAKTKVKVGRMYNGKAEILEGLNEGDQFISKGYQELNEGEEIKF